MKDFEKPLPVGKLPPGLLAQILSAAPVQDERLLVGPGIGLDCAVVDVGENLLAIKSDPITFATDEIGWYAVQVNANDIATSGAVPIWFLMTLLMPEGSSPPELVEQISQQVADPIIGVQAKAAQVSGTTKAIFARRKSA